MRKSTACESSASAMSSASRGGGRWPRCCPACAASFDRRRRRQRRERRGGPRAHASTAKEMFAAQRRRHHVRQPHLGPARHHPAARQRRADPAAGELPGGRARPRHLPLRRADRDQPDGPHVHVRDRRPVPHRRPAARIGRRPARSCSSTCTPKRRARRSPWAGTSMAASRPSSARTRTCRPPTQRILPDGTAFVCDLGMCGPRDSVIGVEPEPVIRKFLTGMPARFTVAEKSRVSVLQLRADRYRRQRRARRARSSAWTGSGADDEQR